MKFPEEWLFHWGISEGRAKTPITVAGDWIGSPGEHYSLIYL